MGKYSRVQFIFTCHTCDKVIRFSIYYGQNSIWNNKDADKLASWIEHEGHDTNLTYEFHIGDKETRSSPQIVDMPRAKPKKPKT